MEILSSFLGIEAFTGTGRFYCSIQRQHINLECDILDCSNYSTNLFRGIRNMPHCLIQLFDMIHADTQLAARLFHILAGLPGGLSGPLGVSGDISDG